MNTDWAVLDAEREISRTQTDLSRLERQEWWSWGTALAIIIVLTIGIAIVCFSAVSELVLTEVQRDLVLRGLLPLVVLFALFSIRQQMLITKLRRQLSAQIGMMATMEVLRPPSAAQREGWKNRRQDERFYFDQRIKVRAGKQMIFGRTRDISIGGIGIVIPDTVPVGQRVTLEFPIRDREIISVDAILRHHRGFYHGFEFVELPQAAMAAVHEVCEGPTVPDLRERT